MKRPRPKASRSETDRALACAVEAARAAGKLMRDNFRLPKKINAATRHDIKLELDVRCQEKIQRILRAPFPKTAVLGEEGVLGDPTAPARWVVDPIDGTVNFTYGIPHACVSIALQQRQRVADSDRVSPVKALRRSGRAATGGPASPFATMVGVVYDPFCDEMWTAVEGGPAWLNDRRIRVSRRCLGEAIIAMGFAKQSSTLNRMLPVFNRLIHRVRKVRIMGAAALSMVYVASGRVDAYLEYGLRLWDIAAGGLILERAGGDFWHQPIAGHHTYRILASNGRLRPKLQRLVDEF
jgi:myo-inositol-1(or 4)-monophosphatase